MEQSSIVCTVCWWQVCWEKTVVKRERLLLFVLCLWHWWVCSECSEKTTAKTDRTVWCCKIVDKMDEFCCFYHVCGRCAQCWRRRGKHSPVWSDRGCPVLISFLSFSLGSISGTCAVLAAYGWGLRYSSSPIVWVVFCSSCVMCSLCGWCSVVGVWCVSSIVWVVFSSSCVMC